MISYEGGRHQSRGTCAPQRIALAHTQGQSRMLGQRPLGQLREVKLGGDCAFGTPPHFQRQPYDRDAAPASALIASLIRVRARSQSQSSATGVSDGGVMAGKMRTYMCLAGRNVQLCGAMMSR